MSGWAYDHTAEFYDEDMGRNAGGRDIPWYVSEASRLADATGLSVLELGCGTGRITLPLAAAGIDVVAADRSRPMLDVLERKSEAAGLAERVHPTVLDMGRDTLTGRYAAVLCPFSAFGYLIESEHRDHMLAGVRDRLAPEGALLLDMFIPDRAFSDLPPGTELMDYRRSLPDGSWRPAVTLVRTKRLTRKIGPNINEIQRKYHFLDANDVVVREVVTTSRQRSYEPPERSSVLDGAGFQVLGCFGDFDADLPAQAPARTAAIIACGGRA